MAISRTMLLVLIVAAIPAAAHAQVGNAWVGFQNETATRLVTSDPLVGANDVQEKDYAWADVDQDGDVDLVVVRKVPFSNPGGKRGVLYMNEDGVLVDRTAQYATANDVPASQGPSQGLLDEANNRDVVFADFNGDGWLDFATAVTISDVPTLLPKYLSHPRIYMNQGEVGGVWQGFRFEWARSPQLYILQANGQPDMNQPYPGRFCSLAAGDVDGDGDIDLYFTDYDTGEVGPPEPAAKDTNDRLWINDDGQGNFTDSWQTRMTSQMLLSAFGMASEIADMNGDGRNDIVKDSALGAPQSVSISYNIDVDPQFELYQQPYSAAPYNVAVGDLNNDNKLDMVITDDSDDRYLLNTGNDPAGQAQFPVSRPFSFAWSGDAESQFGSQASIADLDGDGFKDVIIADMDVDTTGCSRRSHIYHNLGNVPNVTLREEAQQTGSGGWKGAVGLLAGDLTGVYHSAVFDLDGDGDQDMMLGRCSSTAVWMNTRNPCPTVKYGTVSPNSTGQPARVSFYGSGDLSTQKLIFNVTNLPAGATGHLVYTKGKKTPCVSYGDGQLCLVRRTRVLPSLADVTADASGHARIVLDFQDEPFASALPGQHRYFQFLYEDPTGGPAGFNLSEAMDVQVCE